MKNKVIKIFFVLKNFWGWGEFLKNFWAGDTWRRVTPAAAKRRRRRFWTALFDLESAAAWWWRRRRRGGGIEAANDFFQFLKIFAKNSRKRTPREYRQGHSGEIRAHTRRDHRPGNLMWLRLVKNFPFPPPGPRSRGKKCFS